MKPEKYLFNANFDEVTEEEKAEDIEESITQKLRAEFNEELAREKKDAYERGLQDGNDEALAGIEAKIEEALKHVSLCSDNLIRHFAKQTEEFQNETVKLALMASQQLAQELVKNEPVKALETLFTDILSYIQTEPHVLIRVPEGLASDIEQRLKRIVEQKGYAGKISIEPQQDMVMGDWQFEWSEGGVIKNQEETMQAVSDAVERYMESRNDVELNIEDLATEDNRDDEASDESDSSDASDDKDDSDYDESSDDYESIRDNENSGDIDDDDEYATDEYSDAEYSDDEYTNDESSDDGTSYDDDLKELLEDEFDDDEAEYNESTHNHTKDSDSDDAQDKYKNKDKNKEFSEDDQLSELLAAENDDE